MPNGLPLNNKQPIPELSTSQLELFYGIQK